MEGGTPKSRLFESSTRLPLVGETADPWIFLVLAALVAASVLGIAFPHAIFPGDRDARGHVIQAAAGCLVILGAYFTAVNIREARAHQAAERLGRTIDQLGSGDEAVRVAAVKLLQSMALERLDLPSQSAGEAMDARNGAIREALTVVAEGEEGLRSADLARDVLRDLSARGF